MITIERIQAELARTLHTTELSALGERYQGKVRDTYRRGDRLTIVTTDRVSAFDHVLGTIPFKGAVLTEIAVDGFRRIEDLAPHHLVDVPDPNVMVCRVLRPVRVEFVVRGYLTGSLWREYETGKRNSYGLALPDGLRKDQRFERPIFTPSTKADLGAHDAPIDKAEIVARGLLAPARLEEAEALVRALFDRGSEIARARGLILVDTKYELGLDPAGRFVVMDEIHTPDSSRYWVEAEYGARFAAGSEQRMLDKENLRQWLIRERGFSGHGAPPPLDDEIRVTLARLYLDLHARLLGRAFVAPESPPLPRLERNLRRAGLLP